ncbi:MAG: UDP-N-acetylmuramate dehydrogenase [Ruminococcaceae bacterium]|nr:UDP-N-acetylmuramate dehydrogenase [Oscillospiraceae bacterium]
MVSRLGEILPPGALIEQAPMKEHTSFRIGGPADVLALPATEEQIAGVIRFTRENDIPCHLIGNGSNLLVSDDGLRGVVVKIGKNFSQTRVDGNVITAQAGVLLSRVANLAAEHSLSGLEFASGIPGTLGGAVVMNAGAYGGEMCQVVTSTRFVNRNGEIIELHGDAHGFGYRKSVFGEGDVVLTSCLTLSEGERDDIYAKMSELNAARREKQPLEFPSAGSAFKRPEGAFAAKLIDDAGLRGFSVGDAAVSEKHCGFIVNLGNASCEDVLRLMEQVKERVYAYSGIMLEPEVRYLG